MVFFFKRIININGEFKLCENQQYLYILVLELPNNTLNTYPIYSKGYIYMSPTMPTILQTGKHR